LRRYEIKFKSMLGADWPIEHSVATSHIQRQERAQDAKGDEIGDTPFL